MSLSPPEHADGEQNVCATESKSVSLHPMTFAISLEDQGSAARGISRKAW